MRTLSGIKPSGRLHLGNYYGAIRQWVKLQDEGEALYFIANLHSLTSVRDSHLHAELTREMAVALLAFGLDPARAILFRQSDVPEVTELYWILGTVIPMANLERAHSYKDKLARGIAPGFGLFAYPVLMAADILLYGSDVVPVGKDQVQHIELARDWATKFNVEYVAGYEPSDPSGSRSGRPGILKLPEARLHQTAAIVPGTDGQKMSKSYGNTIDLFGDDKDVKKQVMGVKTDSVGVADPKPEDNPLRALLALMTPASEWPAIEASWRGGGTGYGDYKKRLLEFFHAQFGPARRRREELLGDPGEIERVLADGARRAREVARPFIEAVRRAVGLK